MREVSLIALALTLIIAASVNPIATLLSVVAVGFALAGALVWLRRPGDAIDAVVDPGTGTPEALFSKPTFHQRTRRRKRVVRVSGRLRRITGAL